MRRLRLLTILIVASVATLASGADDTSECALAGLTVGSPFPGNLTPIQYRGASTKFFDKPPAGTYVYRLLNGARDTEDYVAVSAGKVAAVIREFAVERLATYSAALASRFGQPFESDDADGRMFGSFGTFMSRTSWIVPECGATYQLVKRTRTRGAIVSQSAAIVVIALPAKDATSVLD